MRIAEPSSSLAQHESEQMQDVHCWRSAAALCRRQHLVIASGHGEAAQTQLGLQVRLEACSWSLYGSWAIAPGDPVERHLVGS